VTDKETIKLGLPKGRMWEGVSTLLRDAGLPVATTRREYRPMIPLEGWTVKMLKPQNIVQMLNAGSRDIGFAGADWVVENRADLIELLDLGLDPVRLVVAAPKELIVNDRLPDRPLTIATEYRTIGERWLKTSGVDATLIRSWGATEVFPPEDSDAILDNTATGATLAANGLAIVDEVMKSTTRLYAHPAAVDDPGKRQQIEDFVLIVQSVLEARSRVMLEVNISGERMDDLIGILPAMREPTVSPLHGNGNFAIKVAAPRKTLPTLIPKIRSAGGTDIVISPIGQLVP
jgi:ATP phosphoribosyltransferase